LDLDWKNKMSDNSQPAYSLPARLIVLLGISSASVRGICSFAYALVLPTMRESFERSWSMAGLNATGAITDAFGGLSYALNVSTAMLGAGVIALAQLGMIR